MPRSSQPALFYHLNNIWYRAQLTKLLIMQSYPFPYYFVYHRPKYESSSVPYSRKHSAYAFSSRWEPKFNTHIKNSQNYSSVYLNFYTLGLQTGRQIFYSVWEKEFSDLNLFLIASWMKHWFVKIFFQIVEVFHPFEEFIPYLYAVTFVLHAGLETWPYT